MTNSALKPYKYDRPIYFDTFPDTTGLDLVAECGANIATVEAMREVVRTLQAANRLKAAIAVQDAVTSSVVLREALYGPGPGEALTKAKALAP